MRPPKLSEVYLQAAKRLDRVKGWDGCCWAIGSSQDYVWMDAYRAMRLFGDYFMPLDGGGYWWSMSREDHEARILALLLMHEIAKDNDE